MRLLSGLILGFWLASLSHSRPSSGVATFDHGTSASPKPAGDSSSKKSSISGKNQTSSVSEEEEDEEEAEKESAKKIQRYVFAHVVAGNAQNYTKEQWISDMRTAQAAHIDAFAINIGVDASNDVQLPLIYDCAKSLGFKVFISFDMNYYAYPGSSKDIEKRVLQFANHTARFEYQNKTFISTFSGEAPGTFMDANQNYTAAWCTLKASLRGHGLDTYFVPGWTGIIPSTSRCADGLLSWDAWPHNTDIPANFGQVNKNVTAQETLYFPDKAAMLASRAVAKTFAAPVAPLFYKHLNPAQVDNYIYRSDDWMMVNRYTNLIKQDVPPEFIELLTWNDYGESHYLRDPQPSANLPSGMVSSHQYVDGFSHTAFLNLLSYFNQWYKSGTPPVMNQTTMYIWYRPHAKDAPATADLLPSPAFANMTEDRIYGYVIPAPNTTVSAIRILSGYQVLEQALFPLNETSPSVNGSNLCEIVEDLSNNNEAEVDGTGILISAPLEPGSQLLELLNDKGETLVSLQGREVDPLPETYNFNYWSGSIAF
ncbi:hypothetical protein MJO29_008617 [Puccinia striiformis f. sp. tritici]|uniref:Glycoside hydrolase family 71 protein n=1 Tax=Puccinia striiformis f. sp. tritici PST-78 TaxID=1165861 RepID=A0A0L0W273_9BASI|nr:hypothetical protein Pst134EB_016336 [Puccinia striiformis f. sp. tritici]KAI7952986.1 hypothetical protein MJO29_008617 [Puccinia striiformis f. sp. tritici]KNF05601.1 hypothetical protein PSTG_01411 [Puccinia striiformis f. sp. tritici PST-78]KNF05602.1 hypothetical protein, variant [Puccinia striiformis f. sp. tritici PST-78]